MNNLIVLFAFSFFATVTEAWNVAFNYENWKNFDERGNRWVFSSNDMARQSKRIGKYHCYAGFEDAGVIGCQLVYNI